MTVEMMQNYAFEDGKRQGANQKAIEDAMILIRDFNVSPEIAAQKMNAPLDKVLELVESIKK